MSTFIRAFPLEDISIVSRAKGGDGRTVEAYAAVFDRAVPIRDHQGEYEEVIAPGSFASALSVTAAPTSACSTTTHAASTASRPTCSASPSGHRSRSARTHAAS